MRLIGATAILVAFATPAADVLDAQATRAQPPLTLRARVIAADSGAPISYARVHLGGVNRVIRTEVDGQFTVEAPRDATVVVAKAGFVRIEVPVASLGGQSEIRLTRAAAISGRVVDENGEPIVDAGVTASASGPRGSPRVITRTDDRGEFRIGGLAPGAYHVAVQTTGLQEALSTAVFNITNGAAPRITTLQQTMNTTYFPDVPDATGAAEIRLDPGGERPDIDFHVPMARAARQPLLITTALPGMLDTRPPIANGATIRGTVSDSFGRPLPLAQVTLNGNASSTNRVLDAEALLSTYRTGFTDERGGYEFTGLRAGNYLVRAAKAGYATPPPSAAQPALNGVRAGDTSVQNVTLTAWGALSGRIRDDFGDPVHGATVMILRSRYERGRRRLVPVAVSPRTTNDRGEFRLFAVPPGDYVVMARVAEDTDDMTGFSPTFYPGTVAGNEARAVTVDLGADVAGVDFALLASATVRVAGQTLDATGNPTTQLRLSLATRSGVSATIDAHVGTDGTFEFEGVPPGQYVLRADAGRTNTFTEGEFVALPLNVGTSDITDLRIQASAGSTITGRFTFDRNVRASDPPSTAVTISAVPDDFDAAPAFIASTQANALGIFQLRGVTGMRRLQVTRVPSRYMVSSILVNGRDVTDELIPFGRANQSLDDVQVVLTDRVTGVTVKVTDGRRPVGAGVHVLMFSTDASKMYPSSRYLHHQITGADGAFTLTGLPTGNYFAAAVAAIPTGDEAWRDPAYLESIISTGTVISIGDGESNTATLRLAERSGN
jgi:protocatechuate 3,4-dioxygenase beta subunit